MVRFYLPGLGLSLRVAVTTNGHSWTAGVVDTVTRAVETADDVIPAKEIKRVCYMGTGTWLPPDEMRAAVILLSAVAGIGAKELWQMAHIGTGLDPQRSRHRSRKPQPVTDSQSVTAGEEIPSGLHPLSLDHEERRRMGLLEASELRGIVDREDEEAAIAAG